MTLYTHQFREAYGFKRFLCYLFGALALAPIFFMLPEILTGQFHKIGISTAAVLGVGGVIIFMAMLMITPLITATGWRWIAPLRWWFGVVFAVTVALDLVLTATTGSLHLKGGFLNRVVGHSFLVVGLTATLLTLVVALTASHSMQAKLGRHWRSIQRLTYVIWGLILVHLALLMGFHIAGEDGGIRSQEGMLFFGDAQRFYQVLFMSVPLVIMRLPFIRTWWLAQRSAHGWAAWKLWVVGLPLLAVMVFFWGGLISYEIEQGTQAYTLEPVDE